MNQVYEPNIEQLQKNTQSLKRAVDTLNIMQEGINTTVVDLVEEIKKKISEKAEEIAFNGVKAKIITQSDNQYDIEFLDTNDCSDETLKSLQGLKLTVQKKDGEYKLGARFGEGTQEFRIGAPNEKLPYQSQVSALEGLSKHLTLIATATGSGKTITKLMFALAARLSGMKVVSVDPRSDLVSQEYEDQKGAVLYNSTTHISRNNHYEENKTHNILSLDRFFAASNKIVNLDKFSKLIKDNNPENRGVKVDLKAKKITIGNNIEIYQDRYKVNGKEVKESIFNNENSLMILDEIQDMVGQGEAYFVEIELLLLLAIWKKAYLVITTATPPQSILDVIKREEEKGNAHIEAQSLKQKINSGVGGRIDITVRKNSEAEKFVQDYVKYNNSQILERSEGESYYYDHTKDNKTSIKQQMINTVMWNLQSPRNRMTLVCSDSNESTKLLQDTILSPEKQLAALGSYNKCNFYQSTNLGNSESIKNRLIDTFGKNKETEINEILKEFDFTGSIAESGVFAVSHGFIDNIISCVAGVPLDQLSKERFLGHKIPQKDGSTKTVSLLSHFKETFAGIETSQINKKIFEYVSSTLKVEDADKAEKIRQGMGIVWNLFIKYKNDNEKLSLLVSNHNLSREIHKMIPPDFSRLLEYNIFEIFAQGHNYGVFKYLKDNYDVSEEIGNKCDTLYAGYKKKSKEAEKHKLEHVGPAEKEWRNALEKVDELESQIYNNVQGLQELLKESKATQDTAYRIYHKHQTAYDDLLKQAVVKKGELITKFKEVVTAFKGKELSELRPISNEFAILEEYTKDECLGDKFSQAGLAGYYFNNHRKSGRDYTILYNVIMRETETDDLKQKKQCVGRTGRTPGPIISSSYVDSSKIGSPDRVKDQLENGSPFDVGEAEKSKIDPQEFAEKMTKQIDGIIIANHSKGESAVVAEVIKCVFATHHELYNHSGYKNDETYKTFTQTLENVTSTLKEKCKKKNIVIGDSIVKFNIRGIESKIGKIADELISLSNELKPHEENRDKINEKLKIEGNFLKRLIIRLCTLVLHLWHWRLSPTQEQISEVLEKDDTPTIMERVISRKAARQVANEMKPLEKKRKRQEDEKTKLTNKRIKLQDEYNGMHEYVGVIKRKDGVTQKEITESEKNSIIKKQLSGIEGELNKTNRSLSESKKKHDKDLKEFEDLKGKIDGIEFDIDEVKSTLEKRIKMQDKLSEFLQQARALLEELDSVNYEEYSLRSTLEKTTSNIHRTIFSKEYKDFFNGQKGRKIKTKVAVKKQVLKSECGEVLKFNETQAQQKAKELKEALEEMIGYIEKKTIPEEKDSQELTKEIHENIKNHENQTQIERLCNLIDTGIANFSNSEVQTTVDTGIANFSNKKVQTTADVKRLLSYLNKFTEEKTRLKKIQREQEALDEKIKELNDEKEKLQNPDADQQMDMCRKLLVYKSINKNYDLRRCMWLLPVSFEFFKNKPDRNDYISSPVFLELFTNIVMPLMNDGTLKIALDIMDPNGDSSAKKVEKINKFYQNLVDRNFDEIKDDVSNVLECMNTMILPMIACTKFNHYTNGLSKDLHLIKNITFSKFDPFDFIATKLQNSSGNNDLLSVLKNVLVESFKGKDPNQLLQRINPITQGIYTGDINSGTTMLTSLNFLMNFLPFVAAKKDVTDNDGLLGKLITMFSDTSAKRATKVIEKFGKGKDQDDIRKVVYENLMIFLNEWKGCGSQITWSGKSLAEEQSAQDSQAYGQKARLASQQKYLPADRLTDPSVHRLDPVQAVAPG